MILHEDTDFSDRLGALIALHTMEAVLAVDIDQRIIYFNDCAESLFGYTRSEVMGRDLDLLVPERYRADHPAQVNDFIGSPVDLHRLGHEHPVPGRRRDGSEFMAEIGISKLDLDGELVLAAVVHDVTARLELEKLREFLVESSRVLTAGLEFGSRAEKLANLIVPRYADWCIIDLLIDGEVRRTAEAHRDPEGAERLRALRDYPPIRERPVGAARVLQTGVPELVQEVTDSWLQALAIDAEHLRRLREMEPKSAMILPLITGGRTLGTLLAVYSGSGRRYTSDDIAIGMEFAGMAALHINNSRLYREAVEASQTRDAVLRMVAHDLRNPLNTIALSAGVLRDLGDHEPGSAASRSVEVIERAVSRANTLIHDLVEVGRLGRGVLGLEPIPTRPDLLVKLAASQHQALASEKGITLGYMVADELPEVLADRDRVYQAFETLIGNAIKFTEGDGKIVVGAGPGTDEVVFRVTDTGPGIEAADIPHLFDPFWQAARTGRSGAGLGLAITGGIVEAHHGRIWVESEVGRGSTFYFTLPVVGFSEASAVEGEGSSES